MDEFDYWRLADSFSLFQAAALICGIRPTDTLKNINGHRVIFAQDDQNKSRIFFSVLMSLKNSIKSNALRAIEIVYTNDDGNIDISSEQTLVSESSLKEWLSSRGFKTGFFFPEGETVDYLTKDHPKYAPKLAACVRAWQYVIKLPDNGKTPKQNIDKWLREHASEFGMTDPDGRPIESAIEQCSKVANWETKGGAPKTP